MCQVPLLVGAWRFPVSSADCVSMLTYFKNLSIISIVPNELIVRLSQSYSFFLESPASDIKKRGRQGVLVSKIPLQAEPTVNNEKAKSKGMPYSLLIFLHAVVGKSETLE